MKQTFFKLLAVMLIGFAALTSCKKEPLPQEQTTNVTFSFRINDPGTDPTSTKSAITSDEEALKVINIAFYDSSTKKKVAENVYTYKSFTMNSVPNVNCDVLVMANVKTDSYEWPELLDDALSIEESVSVSSINTNGIPMAGRASWSAGTTSVTVGLDRLVSRYDVTANKKFTYGTWTLKGVTFSNAANTVTPFKENASPSSKGTFDYATVTDVNNLNGGSTASFYLPEMAGSTAQIKIEGEWTATDMKRTASYELAVGSGNNKRNMKYQVKLDADSSNPVWSVIIGDDQFNNRFVYAGANPLAVTNNGNASTTTLTASSADLQYRLEAASSTADYTTAALSFSTDGSNWYSYSNLGNFALTGSVATLYVKSGYTGSSVIDVPFRFVSADGKVLPAAAGQSADGNTLNIRVAPVYHMNSVTFKLVNKNSSAFKYAEITGLDSDLVGTRPIRVGNAIKLPYSKDITLFKFGVGFPTLGSSNNIEVTVKVNDSNIIHVLDGNTYDKVYSDEFSFWEMSMVGGEYGSDPVIEITFEEENGGGAVSFNKFTYEYYEEVSLNTTYKKTISTSLTPLYTEPLTVSMSSSTLSYKYNGSTEGFGQIWLTDASGHYCHTILVKGMNMANPPIASVNMVLNNSTSAASLESDVNDFTVNGTKYDGKLTSTLSINVGKNLNEDIVGHLSFKRSNSFDGTSNVIISIGSKTSTVAEIINEPVAWNGGTTSDLVTYTITKAQVQAVGAEVYLTIKVEDQ